MKRLQHKIPGSIARARLDEYLMEWLPTALGETMSKSRIRTLIVGGAVYVNRHRLKIPSAPIYSGAYLEVYYDPQKGPSQTKSFEEVRVRPESIVFEDQWLIIVNKPSGLPSQPTVDPNRPNLFSSLKQLLISRDKKADPYLGMHHRIDKDTSGLLLFTKSPDANAGVGQLFAEHKIEKHYQCLAWRSPLSPNYHSEERFVVNGPIDRVSEKGENARYGVVETGGQSAETRFRVIESFRDVYWLDAQPVTGRTHQIRVHALDRGLPLLGDPVYFPSGLVPFVIAPRLMLHAASLRFLHPMTHKEVFAECVLPEVFVQVLSSLKTC